MAQVKHTSDRNSTKHGHYVKGSEIFVGGLARSVTESMIQEMFSPCGEIVELRMMKDHGGISKGFCFVRFATKESALKAQKEKDGFMVYGKKIGVAPSSDQDSLFFGNLHKDWSFEKFNKLVCEAFQDVVSVELPMLSSSGELAIGKRQLNRGFAFVQFSSHAAAARAHRIGSSPDFMLAGDWHPAIDWAEKEPEIDPEELAKIKVAFIGNLPANADEEYLKELFGPLGKLEKVALSRKSHFPVGFVHFANRLDLDNAIKEMDGKTVYGPHKGPGFKIQVSVARPVEKDRKRVREETKSKPVNRSGTQMNSSSNNHTRGSFSDHKSKVPRLIDEVPDVADPYEAAVISLPSTVKEHLLQILRLGIATRYDIDILSIASLKELPESAAIAVLDQFMISGAERPNKGAYFASLIAKHRVDKLQLSWRSNIPRRSNYLASESKLISTPASIRTQAIDYPASHPLGCGDARYSSYKATPGSYPCSSSVYDDALLSPPGPRKLGEMAYRTATSSLSYSSGIRLGSYLSPAYDRPPECPQVIGAHLSPAYDHPPERPQVKFDPFTGQPYKFDPFTGKPIRPEVAPSRRLGGLI